MTFVQKSRLYFFGTGTDDEALSFDEVGHAMAGNEEARRQALAALPDMARDVMPNGDDHTFHVSIRDDDDEIIYRATLVLHGEWVAKASR